MLESTKVTVKQREKTDRVGYIDGPLHKVNCMACGAPLVEIKVVLMEFDPSLEVRADCPHCGLGSEPLKPEGYALHADTEWTAIKEVEFEGTSMIFRTVKKKEYK